MRQRGDCRHPSWITRLTVGPVRLRSRSSCSRSVRAAGSVLDEPGDWLSPNDKRALVQFLALMAGEGDHLHSRATEAGLLLMFDSELIAYAATAASGARRMLLSQPAALSQPARYAQEAAVTLARALGVAVTPSGSSAG